MKALNNYGLGGTSTEIEEAMKTLFVSSNHFWIQNSTEVAAIVGTRTRAQVVPHFSHFLAKLKKQEFNDDAVKSNVVG